MTKIIAVCLLAAAVGAAWVQRNSIAALREKNVELRQQAAKAERAARENRGAPQHIDDQEVQSLVEATKELPKLRNEVRQLRQQKPEIDRLRSENGQLAAQISSGANRPKLAQMEGYVAKEQWAQAGFATPEATIQSFFWAIANQDPAYIVQCMAPKMQREYERQFAGKSPEEQKQALGEGMGPLSRMGGYRIAETEHVSDSKVIIGVEAAAGGHVLKIPLERIGNEWKLNEPK